MVSKKLIKKLADNFDTVSKFIMPTYGEDQNPSVIKLYLSEEYLAKSIVHTLCDFVSLYEKNPCEKIISVFFSKELD